MVKTTVAVVGAGPAGISAAVQLHHLQIPFLLFEKKAVGGLLHNASVLSNLPGVAGPIKASRLIDLLNKELSIRRINPLQEEVTEIAYYRNFFRLQTLQNLYQAEFLVIATGTAPCLPEMEIPEACQNKVFFELPKQLPSGKRIIIIGGGDAAFDYALHLSKKNRITIVARNDNFKCHSGLLKVARSCKRITLQNNLRLKTISHQKDQLELIFEAQNRSIISNADLLIFAIGRKPQLPSFSFDTQNRQFCAKIYFCGDVANALLRQTAIAFGDGVRAAQQIYFQLWSKER